MIDFLTIFFFNLIFSPSLNYNLDLPIIVALPMKSLFKGVRVSKYRHVYGSVARKDQCYDNINITKNAHDSNFCAANPKVIELEERKVL